MNNGIEIERNNVTVAEFLNYIKIQCGKKGLDIGFTRDDFEKPHNEYSMSYFVKDGRKICHNAFYEIVNKLRRKHEIRYDEKGRFIACYYTDDFEEYQERELRRVDWEYDAKDAPCKAETINQFAYNLQTYILNFDGSCYNEICEFTFDIENRGHGYYYQINKEAAA